MANDYLAVSDLTTLSSIDDNILLDYLHRRYTEDVIYSLVGDILISINPYKGIPIYTHEFLCKDHKPQLSAVPHVFNTATTIYHNMLTTGNDQCCIISGESGSGKTEISKYLVRQLTELSPGSSTLEQRIIQVNPLLEGFGNAQTQMNYNSSRFGKYLQLKFNQSGKINGAKINEYLLEKSRVVYQNPGERNFHVFYWLVKGLDPIWKHQLHFDDQSNFRYLGGAGFHGDEEEQFVKLKKCFDLVGFSEEDQYNICVCLAAVLHLGNVVINEDGKEFAYVQQPSQSLDNASILLGVKSDELLKMLTMSISVTKKETISKHLSKMKGEATRDSISKALYDRLFRWIVNQINQLLAPTIEELTWGYDIGILDIFGFENFRHNTFEQLCINLANEQLHNFFIQHIFHLESEEYCEEGLEGPTFSISDCQHLLDRFFLGSQSVFHILDDQVSIPRATDVSFLHKIDEKLGKEDFYSKIKSSNTQFAIEHFAGKVLYSVESFLEKNSDVLPSGVTKSLVASENELISLLFRASINPTGTLSLHRQTTSRISRKIRDKKRTSKCPTTSSQFKSSLTVLVTKMKIAMPHFIRCIKPNEQKSPNNFDKGLVQQQLKHTGMLATVEIRRKGFSYRPSFSEFLERFGGISIDSNTELPSDAKCQLILRDSGIDYREYQIGKSKLFLKHHHLTNLEVCLQLRHSGAVVLQSIAKGFICRRQYKRLLVAREGHQRELRKLLSKVSNDLDKINDRLEKLNIQDEMRETEERRRSDVITGNLTLPKLVPPKDLYELLPTLLIVSDDEQDDEMTKRNLLRKKSSRLQMDECVFVSVKQASSENQQQYYSHQQSRMLRTSVSSSHSWLYGMISQKKAETLLRGQPLGTFLVRINRKKLGHILSYKSSDGVCHVTITQLPNGKYVLVGETLVHDSIDQLVAHYNTNPFSSGNYLTNPCPEESDD